LALSLGTRLGPYEILSALGAGGMGEVYRARDTKLDREVAIKVLPEQFVADAERVARFQREAKTLAALNHPHIGGIYGLEDAGGVRALVLELVEGPTLADRIAQGPIPLDEALPIARQIAEALEAAHEQGIIHRDLKPANIKLRNDGTVKVLDFGLAKAVEPTASTANVSQLPTITSPAMMTGVGALLGTAAYMAPEQARGKPLDKRADIWAFGCVLFEMLTGKRAFEGNDASETLAAVLKGEPEWTALPSEVPQHIKLLVQRCLEKDRNNRVAHLSVVRFVVMEPLAAEGRHDAPARRLWRRVLLPLGAAVFASVLTGAAIWQFKPTPRLAVTRFTYSLGEGQEFTTGFRQLVTISPDGMQMAYVANQRLYLKPSWDVEATPIRGTEEGRVLTTPTFSPDGRWIAFFQAAPAGVGAGTLKKIATTGGVPMPLCQALNPYGMSWDNDSILFGQPGQGILRVSSDGGTAHVVAASKGTEIAHSPQMLPGSGVLLYTLSNGFDWDNAQIVAQATSGAAERKTLIKGGADARYLSTGHIVYAVGGVLWAVPFDLRRLEVVGPAVPIVQGVRRAGQGSAAAHFAVSRTGSLIYVPGPAALTASSRDVALLDRNGVVERLNLPPRAYEFPRVSPDGRFLAVAINDGKETNVWIYDFSGTRKLRRLTSSENSGLKPVLPAGEERLVVLGVPKRATWAPTPTPTV
jgi:serine/threonine-protein kinase